MIEWYYIKDRFYSHNGLLRIAKNENDIYILFGFKSLDRHGKVIFDRLGKYDSLVQAKAAAELLV